MKMIPKARYLPNKSSHFKAILIAFGIGAKTNVGYGQLEEPIKKNNK